MQRTLKAAESYYHQSMKLHADVLKGNVEDKLITPDEREKSNRTARNDQETILGWVSQFYRDEYLAIRNISRKTPLLSVDYYSRPTRIYSTHCHRTIKEMEDSTKLANRKILNHFIDDQFLRVKRVFIPDLVRPSIGMSRLEEVVASLRRDVRTHFRQSVSRDEICRIICNTYDIAFKKILDYYIFNLQIIRTELGRSMRRMAPVLCDFDWFVALRKKIVDRIESTNVNLGKIFNVTTCQEILRKTRRTELLVIDEVIQYYGNILQSLPLIDEIDRAEWDRCHRIDMLADIDEYVERNKQIGRA